MPMQENMFYTGTFKDYMDAGRSSFDPGIVDTFNTGVPEGALNSPSSGPLYISGQIPPLALKQTPDEPVVPHLMPTPLEERTLAPSPFKPKSLADATTIRDQNGYVPRPYTDTEYKTINPQDKAYADAAQLKIDFPEVPFAPGMTKERASYIDDMMTTKKVRDILSEKHPWAYMAGQFTGGAPDITNFVPVFGEFSAGINFSSNILRRAFPYIVSAADNMANVAVSDLVSYQVRNSYGLDVNIQDDITSAALYGLVFHGAGEGVKFGYGKLKDRLSYKIPIPELKTKDPLTAAVVAPDVLPPPAATELPPAIVVPPVAPVEPSGSYSLNGEKVGTTPPIDPFTEYTLNGERVVATSRMIINDAVYNIANGQDISLSESSKGLIEEFHKNGLNNLEEGRYSVARTPEIIAKETELKASIANTASELDALKAADSTGIVARTEKFRSDQHMGITGKYPTAVSMTEKETMLKYEGLKSDISKTNSEIGSLQSKIKGYRTDVPNFMREGVPSDPSLQLDLVDKISNNMLPKEITNLLSPDESKKLRDMAKSATTADDINKIKDILSSKVAPLYAGTYGRLHHGTNKEFDKYHEQFFGESSKSKDSKHGVFLSKSFETSNSYTGFGGGGNIRLENARVDNPFVVSGVASYSPSEFNRVIEKAKELGHDSVILLDTMDGGGVKDDVFIIFDPNKITPALGPIGEVSWATPKVEYGSFTIKDQLPTIEKLTSPLTTEDIKIKEDAKNIGHNLDDANYKLSDTELLDIEILKSSMSPEEIASFDAELKSADNLMNDNQLFSEALNKYAYCKSK